MKEKFPCDMTYLENVIPDIDRIKLNFGIEKGIAEEHLYIWELMHGIGFQTLSPADQKDFVIKYMNQFLEQLKEKIRQDKDYLNVEIISVPAFISTEDEEDSNWIFDPSFKTNHRIMLEYRAVSPKKKVKCFADIVFNKDFTKIVYSF
jgi:hypothetical protein